MVRRSFRIGLRLGILAGVVWAVTKMLQSRQAEAPAFEPTPWTPAPVPSAPTPPPPAPAAPQPEATPAVAPTPARTPPPAKAAPPKKAPPAKAAPAKAVKKAAKKAARTVPKPAWVEPVGNVCPPSHPIKVKLASRIFHVPGLLAYDRTNPDRCYTDERSAASDGFTRAKR